MKKTLSRSLTLLFAVFIMTAVLGMSAQAKTIVSGDFTFETTSSAKATLTEYKGNAASVEIPKEVQSYKVTVIGAEAFWKKNSMKSVTIPDSVTKIEYAAFNECTSLTEIVIPSSVKTIGEAAFWYCTGLKSAVIPSSVKTFGKDAFKGCTSLTAYTEEGSKGEEYIKTLDYVKQGHRYAKEIKLNYSTVTLGLTGTKTLKSTLSPSPLYSSKVTFKSSNTNVATVTAKGVVKAVGLGEATITVTTADGSKLSKKCTVKVNPQAVKNLNQTAMTTSSVTFTWDKISGVTGYKVYKLGAKNTWELISTTAKTTYTDKTLSMGQTAQYKVRAYTTVSSKTYYGAYSSVLSVTLAKPGTIPKLSSSAGETNIKLTWTKADNANGYKVYILDSKTNKFTEKTSTTSLSFNITGLKANSEYKFAVKAYYKNTDGKIIESEKQREITASTKPTTVSGFAYDKNAVYFDRITLKWKAIENISGYKIWVYDTTTEEAKAYTETVAADKTSFIVSNLNPNTKYSFKIRAYTKRDSATVYGNYSAEISVKTLAIPETKKVAFEGFIQALNATKIYDGPALLYKEITTKDFTGDKNEDVLSNMVTAGNNFYIFGNGKDSAGNIVSAYMGPVNAESTLTFADITADTCSYKANGSGYEVTFTLDKEDKSAAKNSLVTAIPDWDKVNQSVQGFSLVSCNYTGTKITAKIQDGLISYMEVSMPVEVSFKTSSGATHSFTQTIVTTTAFVAL